MTTIKSPQDSKPQKRALFGLLIGAGVGTAIGAALKNVAIGVGIGAGVGLLFAVAVDKRGDSRDA